MKKFLLILLALSMCLSVCACKEDKENTNNNAGEDASKEVVEESSATVSDGSNADYSEENSDENTNNFPSIDSSSSAESSETPENNSSDSSEDNAENGSGDMSDDISENTPTYPVIDPDYIKNPSDADFEKFYDFIAYGVEGDGNVFWMNWENATPPSYTSVLEVALSYYTYFGFDIEELEGEYGRNGCGDPLNRFVLPEDVFENNSYYYISATIYDIDALNWIAKEVLNNKAVYPDNEYGYCYDGKYYVGSYTLPGHGGPMIETTRTNNSYEYLDNGQYKFSITYEESWTFGSSKELYVMTTEFVAIPKKHATLGTYWKLISLKPTYYKESVSASD